MNDRSTLREGEYHPAADSALKRLNDMPYQELIMWQASFSSCAIEGNRLAEICSGTIQRILRKEPISDRYLLGLAWAIFHEKEEE